MISKQSSIIINNLKCILCIGVVYIHGFNLEEISSIMGGVENFSHFLQFEQWFRRGVLDATCVPMFFAISGFLFFCKIPDNCNFSVFQKKWKSRITSILVPYLIANLITITLVICCEGKMFSISRFLAAFWDGKGGSPIDIPTWYLRDLMIVCLFAPAIYWAIAKAKYTIVLLFLVAWLTGFWFTSLPGFEVKSFVFFTIGGYYALIKNDVVKSLDSIRYKWTIVVVYLLFWIVSQMYSIEWILRLSVLISLPMWIILSCGIYRLLKIECSKTFVSATFFCFLYHIAVSHRVTALITCLLGRSEIGLFISFFISGLLTVLLFLILYFELKRFFPKTTRLLVGGR